MQHATRIARCRCYAQRAAISATCNYNTQRTRRATGNTPVKHATGICDMRPATCTMRPKRCNMQHATCRATPLLCATCGNQCDLQLQHATHAPCKMQRTREACTGICNMRPATCTRQPKRCNMQQPNATCSMQRLIMVAALGRSRERRGRTVERNAAGEGQVCARRGT